MLFYLSPMKIFLLGLISPQPLLKLETIKTSALASKKGDKLERVNSRS